jgi:hypothetical protein
MEHRRKVLPPTHVESAGSWRKNGGGNDDGVSSLSAADTKTTVAATTATTRAATATCRGRRGRLLQSLIMVGIMEQSRS